MSAPKPKVFRTVTFIGQPGKAAMAHRWTWVCECGASDPSPYGLVLHRLAMDDATLHSRTHTAERIADELDRLFDAYQGAAVFSSDPTRSMFYRGKREGTLDAARLIRTHLV